MTKQLIFVGVLCCIVVANGCADDDNEENSTGGDADSDADTDADADADADSDGQGCEATDIAGLQACIDKERYIEDLETVAIIRNPGSDGWKVVQELLAARLERLGYELEKWDYGSGVNVIGRLPGVTEPDTEVIISAHYDHIPGCPGADDNASAVSGALEIARVLSGREFNRTLVVAFWDEEELGLIGSRHYVS